MSPKSTNPLKISWAAILVIALIAGSGCRQEKANIRVEGKAVDGTATLDTTSSAGGPEMSIVTGEPAIASESEGAPDGATAEDKTGAVAIKIQY